MHIYKYHPTLRVAVRSDGMVLVPQNGKNPAHWTFGSKNVQGYLRVRVNRKFYYVHRLVYEAFIGPIPEGLQVDHINRRKDDNRVFENLRIVTRSQNNRNTSKNDRVDARGGTHTYEDAKQYKKEWNAKHHKTHKHVWFSDGKQHWVPNERAIELFKLPVKERNYVR